MNIVKGGIKEPALWQNFITARVYSSSELATKKQNYKDRTNYGYFSDQRECQLHRSGDFKEDILHDSNQVKLHVN